MYEAWLRWRIRRTKIKAWKQYHRDLNREGYHESLGLGHPEWVTPPSFEDPRRHGVPQ